MSQDKMMKDLKIDLAIREDNKHFGSGLGGNPSEFLWLITNNIHSHYETYNGDIDMDVHEQNLKNRGKVKNFFEKDGKIFFYLSYEEESLGEVRAALTEFLKTKEVRQITFQMLADTTFLRSLDEKTDSNVHILALCVEHCRRLMDSLNAKNEARRIINEVFNAESEQLNSEFRKQFGFPPANNKYSEADGNIGTMLSEHPIFGKREKAINKRHRSSIRLLISNEDVELINVIQCFPKHLCLVSIRMAIGIEDIVRLNLDEFFKFNKLSTLQNSKDEDK